MEKTRIQHIIVECDGDSLRLMPDDGRKVRDLELDIDGAFELMEFLHKTFELGFNRRRSFRIPVLAFSGLTVTLKLSYNTVEASPRDISFTGIHVEVSADDDPELAINSQLQVTLGFEGEFHIFDGVVRRRHENSYGIFFPDCLKGETISPDPKLERIVQAMMRREKHLAEL